MFKHINTPPQKKNEQWIVTFFSAYSRISPFYFFGGLLAHISESKKKNAFSEYFCTLRWNSETPRVAAAFGAEKAQLH